MIRRRRNLPNSAFHEGIGATDDVYPDGYANGSDNSLQEWEERDLDCCFITSSIGIKNTLLLEMVKMV